MNDSKKNLPASIRQRLKNQSKDKDILFNEITQRYAIERFLYRLSVSKYATSFVLKGAQLLTVWDVKETRPTMDIGFLGYTQSTPENVQVIIKNICGQETTEPDGMVFLLETINTRRIKEDAEYEGVRVSFQVRLDTIRINMQIDIGFNDVITPEAKFIEYPSLLDLTSPKLRAYNQNTVIAEKVEAMVKLGALNSRMKDFFDIWTLSRTFPFQAEELNKAIQATFKQRETELNGTPAILNPDFDDLEVKQKQWTAFLRKARLQSIPKDFSIIANDLKQFLIPVMQKKTKKIGAWEPAGPWLYES